MKIDIIDIWERIDGDLGWNILGWMVLRIVPWIFIACLCTLVIAGVVCFLSLFI